MRNLIPAALAILALAAPTAAADFDDLLPDIRAPRYSSDERMTRAQKAQLRGAREDFDATERAAVRAIRDAHRLAVRQSTAAGEPRRVREALAAKQRKDIALQAMIRASSEVDAVRSLALEAGVDVTFVYASTLAAFAETSAENLEFLHRSLVDLDAAARRTSLEVHEVQEENRLAPVRQAVAGLNEIQYAYYRAQRDLVLATADAAASLEAYGDADDLAGLDDAAYAAALAAARLAADTRRAEIAALPSSARRWARQADESEALLELARRVDSLLNPP